MTSSPFSSYEAYFRELTRLYRDGDYAAALALAERAHVQFPERAIQTYNARACLASLSGDRVQALALLEQALADGLFYPDRSWDDTDFDAIRDDPAFARLRAQSVARLAEAQTLARPEVTIRLPGPDAAPPYPLLMALHGNMVNAAIGGDCWRPAAGTGWVVALPQSSQVGGLNAYVWDDEARHRAEVGGHYAALGRAYPVDHTRVVLGGFSRGAEMAALLALEGHIPACGVILVCPGGPLTSRDPSGWEPVLAAGDHAVRVHVIAGAEDMHTAGVRRLADQLRAAGYTCAFEEVPGVGHEFPPDLGARLPGLLTWALGE